MYIDNGPSQDSPTHFYLVHVHNGLGMVGSGLAEREKPSSWAMRILPLVG